MARSGASHDVDSASRRHGPLGVERGAARVGLPTLPRGALQFRLTRCDSCVQLHLGSMDHVKHEAYADDDL